MAKQKKEKGEMLGKYLSSIESNQKEFNWQHFKVEFRVKKALYETKKVILY